MHIFSSRQQTFSAEAALPSEGSSRVLQHSSGNIGLEFSPIITKSEEDTKEAPPIFEPRTRSRGRIGHRQSARKARRLRPYPWETDPTFIRYELNSDRYRLYREKAREGTDQVWPERLELCFQYGKLLRCRT